VPVVGSDGQPVAATVEGNGERLAGCSGCGNADRARDSERACRAPQDLDRSVAVDTSRPSAVAAMYRPSGKASFWSGPRPGNAVAVARLLVPRRSHAISRPSAPPVKATEPVVLNETP
jgi:hypothetical protein